MIMLSILGRHLNPSYPRYSRWRALCPALELFAMANFYGYINGRRDMNCINQRDMSNRL